MIHAEGEYMPMDNEELSTKAKLIDITSQGAINIRISDDGSVVWINDSTQCLVRICQIWTLRIQHGGKQEYTIRINNIPVVKHRMNKGRH